MIQAITQDVRFGLRQLRRQPTFTIAAVITLALGIGLSAALFSVIDVTMLHPLPYSHPEELADVSIRVPQRDGRRVQLDPSLDDVRTMRASQRISDLAVMHAGPLVLLGEDQLERVPNYEIDEYYLPLFRVVPLLGRGIRTSDTVAGAAPVVILGYDYWKTHFDRSSTVIGQNIKLASESATVVGVLPSSFEHAKALWRPFSSADKFSTMRGAGKSVIARLRPGVDLAQVSRELTAGLSQHPGGVAESSIVLDPLLERTSAKYRQTINVLSGAVALILLLACVNVAGLSIARGSSRSPEMAIRTSIGASRPRLIQQLLTESVILAIAGGVLGVVIAWWSLDLLTANIPLSFPTNTSASLNLRVLALTTSLTIAVGLAFGVFPAWRLSRSVADAQQGHRQVSSLSRRTASALIVVEMALTVVLLTAAGVMIRSFDRMLSESRIQA